MTSKKPIANPTLCISVGQEQVSTLTIPLVSLTCSDKYENKEFLFLSTSNCLGVWYVIS